MAGGLHVPAEHTLHSRHALARGRLGTVGDATRLLADAATCPGATLGAGGTVGQAGRDDETADESRFLLGHLHENRSLGRKWTVTYKIIKQIYLFFNDISDLVLNVVDSAKLSCISAVNGDKGFRKHFT